MKSILQKLLEDAVKQLKQDNILPEDLSVEIHLNYTKEKSHGDFATNLAMMLSKKAGYAPRDMAQEIINAIKDADILDKTEIAGPGFINFFLSQSAQTQIIKDILEIGCDYGKNQDGQQQPIQVEFVSANPTGPLHVGHGRGAVIGDSICRLLQNSGWDVTREFYYNDAGQQIKNLALSVQARCKDITPDSAQWQDDWYKGDYIADIAQSYLKKDTVESVDKHITAQGDIDNLQAIQEFSVTYLRHEQDLDLKAFSIDFDVYFLESDLYKDGSVESIVKTLMDNGHTYEKDQALWLKTTEFGDDKDRVMRKADGHYTYFVPDVAYHLNKWQRGFKSVINEQGADHHSTITRVRAGLQALEKDIPQGYPSYVLHQMVTVMRGGEEVKIAKRAGSYVTLRDLIDEVGCDATRYFLVARRPDSQLTFDIDLARSQTNENPVYYIQYAHARICSAFRKLPEHNIAFNKDTGYLHLSKLTLDAEIKLLDRLRQYQTLVRQAAIQYEPHSVAHYLRELATDIHSYYQAGNEHTEHRWIMDDHELCQARLCLICAAKQILANGLDLLGISAPESM